MTPELGAARTDGPKVIDGEVVEATAVRPDTDARPSADAWPAHGLLSVRTVVLVVLLLATVVSGTLFARERSAREEERRHQRAQSTRLAQRSVALAAELAVVRAQRDRLVRAAETRALSPAATAMIRACVQHYADLERALATPGAIAPAASATACINAEPYVR